MQIYGIYVPDRDASWEIDGTAGAGLDGSQERRVPCDAKVSKAFGQLIEISSSRSSQTLA